MTYKVNSMVVCDDSQTKRAAWSTPPAIVHSGTQRLLNHQPRTKDIKLKESSIRTAEAHNQSAETRIAYGPDDGGVRG